jgi:hypothetical protein
MSIIKIKNFSEIDVVNIDASQDTFQLSDGTTFRFSDHMCDNCWTAGTVLETMEQQKRYHCLLCDNALVWVSFKNDFLPPTGDMLEFLLPVNWNEKDREGWYTQFKERRMAQEKIKADILEHGKE